MKKVGIVTFHDGINYGAFMQVFSLQRALETQGYDVDVIHYKQVKFWFKEYVHFLKMNGRLLSNYKKISKFERLQKKRLNLTSFSFDINKLTKGYDAIYFGSDEIWNINNPGFGFNPVYFGRGIDCRLIAYAPSFGATQIDDENINRVKEDLLNFDKISVRDTNSYKIVEKLTNQVPLIVADPTLLVEQKSLLVEPEQVEEYLLVYASSQLTVEQISQIKTYAEINNLLIISIGYKHAFAHQNLLDLDPFEWQGYIKYAQCVVTTMFHGTLFSLIYNRPLSIILTPYREAKFSTVIESCKLQSALWKGGALSFNSSYIFPQKLKEESFEFLKL